MNPQVSKGKFIPPDTNKFNASRDLKEIKGHYEHRASLRKNYPGTCVAIIYLILVQCFVMEE